MKIFLLLLAISLFSQNIKIKKYVSQSLYNEALRAIRISLKWFQSKQSKEGYWSNPDYPALTGLVILAFIRSPDTEIISNGPERGAVKEIPPVKKGIQYILKCVQKDGGIYVKKQKGTLKNYNTAICITALAATMNPKYTRVILRGRSMLAKNQYLGKGIFYGGMGYDEAEERKYADLSNTSFAVEAIRLTDYIETKELLTKLRTLQAKEEYKSLNWEAAIKFISRTQNLPETNDQPWASDHPDEKGGFVYHPNTSKAGEWTDEDGSRRLHSYGSMSYAGVLSLLYAKLTKDDIRVKTGYQWILRHFTLEENPRLGKQGLYFYYYTMARMLQVYGEEVLNLPDGRKVAWRAALIKKLIELQKIEPKTGYGYWINDVGRWWENDPVLATAYAVNALDIALIGQE